MRLLATLVLLLAFGLALDAAPPAAGGGPEFPCPHGIRVDFGNGGFLCLTLPDKYAKLEPGHPGGELPPGQVIPTDRPRELELPNGNVRPVASFFYFCAVLGYKNVWDCLAALSPAAPQ